MRDGRDIGEVLTFIEKYVGAIGAKVFEVLVKNKKEMLDTDIVSVVGLSEQDIRRALYELHNLGLVMYKKVRSPSDNKYIYYWFIDITRLNHVLLQRKKAVLKRLKERLTFEESNTFYTCPVDDVRLTFEEAMENDFRCPRCGEMLVYEDNNNIKSELKEFIKRLEEEILNEERTLTH